MSKSNKRSRLYKKILFFIMPSSAVRELWAEGQNGEVGRTLSEGHRFFLIFYSLTCSSFIGVHENASLSCFFFIKEKERIK